MQWLKGRNVLFGALAVVACSGDPTGNESTPTDILSDPEVVFVTQGDSQPVIVKAVDEDGQVLQADFKVSNVGEGITVRLDPTYQEVTTGNPIQRGSRFFVSGVTLAHTSFKVTALGLSKTIDVTSVPGQLDATITDSMPELGDTVTIRAPEGTFFTDTSTVTFNGAPAVIVSLAADSIAFIPLPNTAGPALVSSVGVESNSSVVFDLTTPFNVTTDSIIDIGTAISNPTPALGEEITLTLPAGLKLLPESLTTLSIAGNSVLPRNRHISADSSTITFIPPPNADSFVVVNGVVPSRLAACCGTSPGYPLLLSTTGKVTTPVVDSIPANLAPGTTLAANDPVTVTTTDAAFSINPDASVLVGADPTPVVFSVAGDGSSIKFLPTPGSTGAVSIVGVSIAGFSLTLPVKAPAITVDTIVPAANSDDPASAPALPVPAAGETVAFWDTPDFATTVDHFYRFDAPAAGNYTFTVNWDVGDDVDAIVCTDATCSAFVADTAGNQFPAATGAQPESGTFPLTAGPKILLIEDFGGADDDDTTLPAVGAKVLITISRE